MYSRIDPQGECEFLMRLIGEELIIESLTATIEAGQEALKKPLSDEDRRKVIGQIQRLETELQVKKQEKILMLDVARIQFSADEKVPLAQGADIAAGAQERMDQVLARPRLDEEANNTRLVFVAAFVILIAVGAALYY